MNGRPSIVVWIDPSTQEVKNDFMPQTLKPGEYGVVLAFTITHIARVFVQSNPSATEADVIAEIRRGIEIGIAQRPPATPMSSH